MEIELPLDFKELLRSLKSHKVEYLLIGGYAVILHHYPRFTSDLDIVISAEEENIARCLAALDDFGFGDSDLSAELFADPESLVRMGVEPIKIEILNYLKGLDFAEAYARRESRTVEDFEIDLISLPDLLTNKLAVGRTKDILDVEELRERNNFFY